MARFNVEVTPVSDAEQTRLGPAWSEYVVLVDWMRSCGMLDEIADGLRLRKKQGYQGVDIVLFLLAFFVTQHKSEGLHGFSDRTRKVGEKLAGVGGRQAWPTQASVSRSLDTITADQARQFGGYLLRQSLDVSEIVEHPSVMHFDGRNEPWHVVDFDPTNRAIRQRALAEADDLFAPKRGAEKLGAPGYNGRKRGEVVVSRPMLQHRGSRLWLGAQLHAGTGNFKESVERGFESVEDFVDRQDLEVTRSLMCLDGEQGGWTQVRAGLNSSVSFLTRITLYRLLEPAEVRRRLDACGWQPVTDGQTGPAREAAELGSWRLEEGTIRLVVSRFRPGDAPRGAGTVIDGWQYEVFATDVSADRWPAADAVALYFGRSGQENYFALEDRQLQLDRTFSQEPGGQLVACLVGLWLWNLQILMGWESLETIPARHDAPGEASTTATHEAVRPSEQSAPPASETVDAPPTVATDIPEQWPELPDEWWAERFEDRDGWHWDAERGLPVCPAGYHLRRLDVRELDDSTIAVRFRARRPPCRECPLRSACTRSKRADFRKEISLSIDKDIVAAHEDTDQQDSDSPPVSQWTPPDGPSPHGDYEPRRALLKPQVLRHRFEQMCRESRIYVDVDLGDRPPPTPEIYVADHRDRLRSRRPWSDKLVWNALHDTDTITVRISAHPRLRRLLDRLRPPDYVNATG